MQREIKLMVLILVASFGAVLLSGITLLRSMFEGSRINLWALAISIVLIAFAAYWMKGLLFSGPPTDVGEETRGPGPQQ